MKSDHEVVPVVNAGVTDAPPVVVADRLGNGQTEAIAFAAGRDVTEAVEHP